MKCPHCDQHLAAVPLTVAVWYMHDNHTFTQLHGDIDAVVERARKLGIESPWGMLGAARLLGPNDREMRSVGKGIHAKNGFDEGELLSWRTAVLADEDAARLLAERAP